MTYELMKYGVDATRKHFICGFCQQWFNFL